METEIVTPLSDIEIKDGIAYKVAESVRAALDKYGPLFGSSFPKFRCIGNLHLTLDNFGLESESNHGFVIDTGVRENVVTVDDDIPIDIPETPPNQFRRETDQSVPVMTTENGKPVERAVVYQARKDRPRRGER